MALINEEKKKERQDSETLNHIHVRRLRFETKFALGTISIMPTVMFGGKLG